jgi:fumarylacetoacetate (FAA) hydrolase family protein
MDAAAGPQENASALKPGLPCFTMQQHLSPSAVLPADHERAVLIGRVWIEGTGPVLVRVREEGLYDLSHIAATASQLLEMADPVGTVREYAVQRIAATADVLANTAHDQRNPALPWLLAPCDLQAIKAAGVTFVASMLERVIEEQARGDAGKARPCAVGGQCDRRQPAQCQARLATGGPKLREVLIAQGVWSQYLEVGIGEDAEIFTKAQPHERRGCRRRYRPAPQERLEQPRARDRAGRQQHVARPAAAALGNDVNLRDFEGRSALLLGKAKDNNASAAIGPFIRLFDDHFGIDDVRSCELAMQVTPAMAVSRCTAPAAWHDQPRPAGSGGPWGLQAPITSTPTASCSTWAPCLPLRRTALAPARASPMQWAMW